MTIYSEHTNVIHLIETLTNGHIRDQGSCSFMNGEKNILYLFCDYNKNDWYVDFSLTSEYNNENKTFNFSAKIRGRKFQICQLEQSIIFLNISKFIDYYNNNKNKFTLKEITEHLIDSKNNIIKLVDLLKKNFYYSTTYILANWIYIGNGKLFNNKKWIYNFNYNCISKKFTIWSCEENKNVTEVESLEMIVDLSILKNYKRGFLCF
jgi:hypothetical protein